jgi:hypothetical protein
MTDITPIPDEAAAAIMKNRFADIRVRKRSPFLERLRKMKNRKKKIKIIEEPASQTFMSTTLLSKII